MEELMSAVKQNAANARQANQLAVSASRVALKGGTAMQTMSVIGTSSKKVFYVIRVIGGIAFKTNILAPNAAAKEIKTLICDSAGKVEEGGLQALKEGKTMDEIVGSVHRVTDIMAEIEAVLLEQTQGINQAITQMDQVTQRHAAASLQEQTSGLWQVVSVFQLGSEDLQPASSGRRLPVRHTPGIQTFRYKRRSAFERSVAAPVPKICKASQPAPQLMASSAAGKWEEPQRLVTSNVHEYKFHASYIQVF